MSDAAADAEITLPRTWRPLGPRLAGLLAGAALIGIMVVLWVGFDDATRASVTPFQRGTVVVAFLLGYGCLYGLGRSRVEAHEDRLVVVNGYRRHELSWAQVVGVRLPPGAPWATLDLTDGTTCSVMAVQGSDGQRARRAVAELRVLLQRADPPGH